MVEISVQLLLEELNEAECLIECLIDSKLETISMKHEIIVLAELSQDGSSLLGQIFAVGEKLASKVTS